MPQAGNAVILRGGSESYNSSQAILRHAGWFDAGIDNRLDEHQAGRVGEMLPRVIYRCNRPQGGKNLGNLQTDLCPCSLNRRFLYPRASSDKMARDIVLSENARTGICGATDPID